VKYATCLEFAGRKFGKYLHAPGANRSTVQTKLAMIQEIFLVASY